MAEGRATRGRGLRVVARGRGLPAVAPGRGLPAALVVALGVAARVLYAVAPRPVAEVAFPVGGALLVLGPALVHPWMRARGASLRASAAGALALPALWLAKEAWRMGGVYGAGEALFYLLNPVCAGVVLAAVFGIAAGEAGLRLARRGASGPAQRPALVALALALLALAGALRFAGDDATEIFYAYIALYRWLFG
jgi:hypothetical protein